MDKVRFGRALGAGAREAAKALIKAADAATAPDPTAAPKPAPPRPAPTRPAAPTPAVSRPAAPTPAAPAPVRVAQRVQTTQANLKEGGKRFGQAAWSPLARAGGVLWLEVTGVLFALFAFVSGTAVWKDRNNFTAGGAIGQHAWFALGMFALFAYCTVSSYVKAARRAKR